MPEKAHPKNLAALGGLLPPSCYPKGQLVTGIVHFGVGAFHRAHEAMFVDRLLAQGHYGWAICGVGLLPDDRVVRDRLAAQDNQYTLMTESPVGVIDARIIASIHRYLYGPDDPEAVVTVLADPRTHIVSLTITEGGYGVDDLTGEFAPTDTLTLADLDDGFDQPVSVLGYLVAGLNRRRQRGSPPFSVMSCDNIQGNGHVVRTALVGFAARKDPELAAWIDVNVAFPNSMVDRITPATTDETRLAVKQRYGISDLTPVRSESFAQWVLEDSFSDGRPPLERVGVQVVADVKPYELMKLRLLNASHQAMSYLGILAGEIWVDEVCRDPLFGQFLLDYMHLEAIPTLPPVPETDLGDYCDQLIARFSSTPIRDTLARQVIDGSDRIPKFLLPVLRHYRTEAVRAPACVLTLAAWSRYLEGVTETGEPIQISDRRADGLAGAVHAELASPGAFLDYVPVFGDLGRDAALREAFTEARASLRTSGVRATLSALNHSRTAA
jgi:mannitol 2-dehydrogenase